MMADFEDARIAIPQELFALAGSSRFQGTVDLGTLEAGPDAYVFSAPASWAVDVTNTGGALLLSGTVSGRATTACARCLASVEVSLEGEVEEYLLIGERDEGDPRDAAEAEFDRLPEDKVVDLEPYLRAALLMEVPRVPLCSEGCKGLCPQCGADLNEGPCPCGEPDAPDEENPFAVLKDFM